MCRHLFNWSLAERKAAYDKDKTVLSYYDQANKLPALKAERPWFQGVYSQVLQDVLQRVNLAYQAFYRYGAIHGIRPNKNGKKLIGYPNFKKYGQWNTLTYPICPSLPVNGKLYIPKVGEVRITMHRELPLEAQVKTMSITCVAGKYYTCFTWEASLPQPVLKQALPAIGIDMGCKNFVYVSDGSKVEPPLVHYNSLHQRLVVLQKRLSKAEKGTLRKKKLLLRVQKVHAKIANLRKEFHHKTANMLLAKSNLMIIEDLDIKAMLKRPNKIFDDLGKPLPNGASYKAKLHKGIAEMGWYSFTTIMKYKADALGKAILRINPNFTSQLCSSCGSRNRLLPNQRHYCCKACGYEDDRDSNASKNILKLGLAVVVRERDPYVLELAGLAC